MAPDALCWQAELALDASHDWNLQLGDEAGTWRLRGRLPRGQRQGDDQPDHRLAQRVAMLVVHRGLAIMLVVHHIGPKKVLSTVSLSSPSPLRMVKTTSWRTLPDAGPLRATGSDSTY